MTTTTGPSTPTTMLTAFPALYLYQPNADSFRFVKHINLTNNQRVVIGRQANARTIPAENNGYFHSIVLSRQHAAVWEEAGKVCACLAVVCVCTDEFGQIFIKDTQSFNGTFINGERLSPEGIEGQPYELKSDDIVVCTLLPPPHKPTHHFSHRNSESTS